MKRKKLFQVANGSKFCYPGRGAVLNVCEFGIYAGDVVVILGNSGAGKSTFIETLGLMSNTLQYTIDDESEFKEYENWNLKESDNVPDLSKKKKGAKIKTGEIIFDPEHQNIKFPDIWNGKSINVSNVRRENFNFIFQDNNLMHNLSNADNIILADLIDKSKDYESSYNETISTFKKLNIDQYQGDPPNSISGGERQRVAFARGVQPKHTVLFGDEPTGNLDEAASDLLMKLVRKDIDNSRKETEPDKAVVIVSHNIPLSLKFADKIIILTKSSGNNHYEILPDNIYQKTQINEQDFWSVCETCESQIQGNQNDENKEPDVLFTKQKFTERIINILENNVKQTSGKKGPDESNGRNILIGAISAIAVKFLSFAYGLSNLIKRNNKKNSKYRISKQFAELLFKKETQVLAGIKNTNIWVFSALIFVTFMVLGFANGQMNELKEKLISDPFTKTINVQYKTGEIQKKTREYLLELSSNADSMAYYGISDITEYHTEYLTFFDGIYHDRHDFKRGRTMHHDNPLLDKIMDPNVNGAEGIKFSGENDMGLIVTKDLLKELHYQPNTPVIFLKEFVASENKSYKVPIPVVAVVNYLPGKEKNYFLFTPNFRKFYFDNNIDFPIEKHNNLKIALHLGGNDNKKIIGKVQQALIKESNQKKYKKLFQIRKVTVELDSSKISETGFVEFLLKPRPPSDNLSKQTAFIDTLLNSRPINEIAKENNLKIGLDIFQTFFSEIPNTEFDNSVKKIGDPYLDEEAAYVSFLFVETDMIRAFAKRFNSVTRKFEDKGEGLALDISKVESMHVFNKVSSLTTMILIFLISFSIATIMIFVYNLLNMHLYKIRKNIGTLMAFGVDVTIIYRIMLYAFTTFCFIVPFALAIIVGYAILNPFTRFSLFVPFDRLIWTIGTILAIFLGTLIVNWFAYLNYFRKTPSALIYGRIGNNFIQEIKNKLAKIFGIN